MYEEVRGWICVPRGTIGDLVEDDEIDRSNEEGNEGKGWIRYDSTPTRIGMNNARKRFLLCPDLI